MWDEHVKDPVATLSMSLNRVGLGGGGEEWGACTFTVSFLSSCCRRLSGEQWCGWPFFEVNEAGSALAMLRKCLRSQSSAGDVTS